ncbi:MAG TPA: CCA tRNA nucleotidyltransferase [Micropepsaceae bacterium]|nr:CCA tRNA nucleotidyltransferase [Micropepsaceae bacterium]
MNVRLDPGTHPWMTEPGTRAVMRALKADGGDARFVGGAVRNALLGETVGDVDIATPLVPQEVMQRLQNAGLGAVPTGIDHGTVTAIANGKPFEVTTLRRDVETDGRHAVIAFSTDWREDAARRDFTINALYADEDGAVYDYFAGLADLHERRVRFVGDAATRIREDYLRILRLFRFHAWYGKGELDAEALAAAVAEKAGLKRLSGERVQKELLRLLEAKDPSLPLGVMQNASILGEILPANLQLARLKRLVAIQIGNDMAPDAVLRLAALLPDGIAPADEVAGRLRFSNALRGRLLDAAEKDARIGTALDPVQARKLLYDLHAGCFRDQVLLRWAATEAEAQDAAWRSLVSLADNWTRPVFPLDGNDVMALGFEEGPEIGVRLKAIERWWVERGFAPDRAALLDELKRAAMRPRA